MVAFLRFLQHGEILVERGFVFESGAVNALELRVVFVAFVIGAGDVRELECADVARAHNVGPGAEIDKIAVFVEADFFAFGNVFDDVQLEDTRLRTF